MKRTIWMTAVLIWLAFREDGFGQGIDLPSSFVTNRTGVVKSVDKKVVYRQPAQFPGEVPAQISQTLEPGSSLRSDRTGTALVLFDRSALRLAVNSLLSIREKKGVASVSLEAGAFYVLSRSGPRELEFATPHGSGTALGTEYEVRIEGNRTVVTLMDGSVELSDIRGGGGTLRLEKGEEGVMELGKAPRKAILRAENLIQWWLYYPAVLDPEELTLSPGERQALGPVIDLYRAGNPGDALRELKDASPDRLEGERLLRAALELTLGNVASCEQELKAVPERSPHARALRTLIAAVQQRFDAIPSPPETTGEYLAQSYWYQARHDLPRALALAREATSRSPEFGYGWVRVAELEFGFGRKRAAREAVEKALKLSPRHAEGHSLRGFILASEKRMRLAKESFGRAMSEDYRLGNAWLGRGLSKIYEGDILGGRQDIEMAATLEPQRSIFRSYSGKAADIGGDHKRALKDYDLAKEKDEADPTPWFYEALSLWQNNEFNAAVRSLERSVELNDNRAVYRSRFLLDEDRAVRGASLAKMYRDAGLAEVGLREAMRSVTYDYANYAGHLFLAESYDTLRDPTRFNLRNETVWFNELLLANLLAPVGAGAFSQNISQQEFSRLFESKGLGLDTTTEYRSDGQWRQRAIQSGVTERLSYALDVDYQHNDGVRPNNQLDRLEWYTTLKVQLTQQDTLLTLIKLQDYKSGDNFQHYDWRRTGVRTNFYFDESQAPISTVGYHREWNPQSHTLILVGQLSNDQMLGERNATNYLPIVLSNTIISMPGAGFDHSYQSDFRIYSAELNHIFQAEKNSLILGARLQVGYFDTSETIDLGTSSMTLTNFPGIAAAFPHVASSRVSFDRVSSYFYDTVKPTEELALTAGLAFDHLRYPTNFRHPPIDHVSAEAERWNPKAALVWVPSSAITVRGAYAHSLGGVSYDESYRLEPTQLAGFAQSFRTLIPESLVGSVSAPRHDLAGAGLDVKLQTRTYVGLRAEFLRAAVDRTLGTFQTTPLINPVKVGSVAQRLRYEERSLGLSLHQLVGDDLAAGFSYSVTDSKLRSRMPEVRSSVLADADRLDTALLHRMATSLLFSHPSGFFVRAEGAWYLQSSEFENGAPRQKTTLNDSSFPQVNLIGGYRLPRRRGEVSVGVLNLTGKDYRLTPLTPYSELPRERVYVARLTLSF